MTQTAEADAQRWSSGALRGFLRKVAWNEMLERKRDTR